MQSKKELSQIETFLSDVDDFRQNGFLFSRSKNDSEIDDQGITIKQEMNNQEINSEAPMYEQRKWEYRLAILPEKENLQKSALHLAPLYDGLNFKFLLLANPKQTSIDNVPWDATNATLDTEGDSDRNQCTKENCVYMRYDGVNNRYEKTPLQWKRLQLQAWKTTIEQNIKIGYMSPPIGEKEVPIEGSLISPFSYTANKPWNNRHGILLEKYFNPTQKNPNHNPHGYEDLLQGVIFTIKDLIEHGISIKEIVKMQYERITYMEQHLKKRLGEKDNFLDKIKADTLSSENFLLRVKNILLQFNKEKDENKLTFVKNNLAELQWIAKHCPRKSDARLNLTEAAGTLNLSSTLACDENNAPEKRLEKCSQIAPCLETIAKESTNEIETTKKEFREHIPVEEVSGYTLSDNKSLIEIDSLIDKDPANMQVYFRRMVHLAHEAKSLQYEKKRLQQRINNASSKTLFEAIQSLSSDDSAIQPLKTQLIELEGELYELLMKLTLQENNFIKRKFFCGQNEQEHRNIDQLRQKVKNLIENMLKATTKDQKLVLIQKFEDEVSKLFLTTTPTWKKIARIVGCIIIAAVGAVVGAAVGAIIEGFILAALSAPAGGIAGVFGIISGTIHGSMTGWSIGIMAAAGLGLMGAGIGNGLCLFKVNTEIVLLKDSISSFTQKAREYAESTI